MRKYSVFLDNVGTAHDRYCPQYAEPYSLEDLFERAASIDLLSAVDLVATPNLLANWDTVRRCLDSTSLKVVSIAADTFTQARYGQGSFSSIDPDIRAKALEHAKQVMDLCGQVGCDLLTLWPGQDGWDYLFQADYIQQRQWIIDAVGQLCACKPDMRVALEYKAKEPRTHSYVSTVGTTLLMAQATGCDNAGVIIDFGHALLGYENPAESVCMCRQFGDKLMHIHINDNYRHWDDDMIVGSVRSLEYLEFFYWLRRTGYDGYLTIDQFPYREDGRDAVAQSAAWLDFYESILDRAETEEIDRVVAGKDAVAASKLMRKLLSGA
jgi:xylose isomerase